MCTRRSALEDTNGKLLDRVGLTEVSGELED
jgi:hypothetical protein